MAKKFARDLKSARCTLTVVHGADHYTYLELCKDGSVASGEGFEVVYKDSWRHQVGACTERAQQILRNLSLREIAKQEFQRQRDLPRRRLGVRPLG